MMNINGNLPIAWETLEHEGPGIYDEARIAQFRKLLLDEEKQGKGIFLEPQGDGVPFWTLEKIGMDPAKLGGKGAWDYAAATIFTLFWGGNTFAPQARIDGESTQDWLQTRYIEAMAHCRRRLKNCKALAGWTPPHKPNQGFIGWGDLKGLFSPEGVSILSVFKEGFSCPWKQAGVWTEADGEVRILKPDYFSLYQGRPVNFAEDFLAPFTEKLLERVNGSKRPA